MTLTTRTRLCERVADRTFGWGHSLWATWDKAIFGWRWIFAQTTSWQYMCLSLVPLLLLPWIPGPACGLLGQDVSKEQFNPSWDLQLAIPNMCACLWYPSYTPTVNTRASVWAAGSGCVQGTVQPILRPPAGNTQYMCLSLVPLLLRRWRCQNTKATWMQLLRNNKRKGKFERGFSQSLAGQAFCGGSPFIVWEGIQSIIGGAGFLWGKPIHCYSYYVNVAKSIEDMIICPV